MTIFGMWPENEQSDAFGPPKFLRLRFVLFSFSKFVNFANAWRD